MSLFTEIGHRAEFTSKGPIRYYSDGRRSIRYRRDPEGRSTVWLYGFVLDDLEVQIEDHRLAQYYRVETREFDPLKFTHQKVLESVRIVPDIAREDLMSRILIELSPVELPFIKAIQLH